MILAGWNRISIIVTTIPQNLKCPLAVAANSLRTDDLRKGLAARPSPNLTAIVRIRDYEIVVLPGGKFKRQQFVEYVFDDQDEFVARTGLEGVDIEARISRRNRCNRLDAPSRLVSRHRKRRRRNSRRRGLSRNSSDVGRAAARQSFALYARELCRSGPRGEFHLGRNNSDTPLKGQRHAVSFEDKLLRRTAGIGLQHFGCCSITHEEGAFVGSRNPHE